MDADPDIEDILDAATEALENGDLDQAKEGLQRAEEIDALDRDVLLFRAQLFLTADDLETARTAVDALIEHHDDDPVALASAAGMLVDIDGDVATALSLAEDADAILEDLEVDPEDRDAARDMRVEVLALIADCRLALGDREGSRSAAESAMKLGPDHIGARVAAGRAAFSLGRLPEAKSAFSTVLALDAEDAEAAWNLGWVERLLGDDAAADAAFDIASRLAPEEFAKPGSFTAQFLTELLGDIAIAIDAPHDQLVRGVPVVVEDLPAIEVDGPITPTTLLRIEGKPPHDLPFEQRLTTKPERIRIFRRNVEVVAQDEDSATGVLEAALGEHLAEYLGLEISDGVDEGDEDSEDERPS